MRVFLLTGGSKARNLLLLKRNGVTEMTKAQKIEALLQDALPGYPVPELRAASEKLANMTAAEVAALRK